MKTRNYGIDFLRIISMIMIVSLHFLRHGGVLGAAPFLSVHYELVWMLEILAFCAVNCYAMISGFVGIDSHFRFSNIIALWFHVFFYGFVITAFYSVWLPDTVHVENWLAAFFPVTQKEYWYFTAYFGIYFFIPFINHLLNTLSHKQLKSLLAVILIIFSLLPTITQEDIFFTSNGYSPLWLMLMYIFGACIKKCSNIVHSFNNKLLFFLYLNSAFITWGWKLINEYYFLHCKNSSVSNIFFINYTSPTIIIMSVSLLIFFSKLELKQKQKKMITKFAPYTFGVYLIHDHPLIRANLMNNRFAFIINHSSVTTFLLFISFVLSIYFFCTFVDYIRNIIFKLLHLPQLINKMSKLLKLLKLHASN